MESFNLYFFVLWLGITSIKQGGLGGEDPLLLEKFCTSITSAQVRSNALMQRAQAYLVMRKRATCLASLSMLSESHRLRLMRSPVFTGQVFDHEVLETVLKEHAGDVTTRSGEVLMKAMATGLSFVRPGPKRAKMEPKGPKATDSSLAHPRPSTSGLAPTRVAAPQARNGGRGRGGRGGRSGGEGTKPTPRSTQHQRRIFGARGRLPVCPW